MKIHKKNPMIMKIFFGPGLLFDGYAHILLSPSVGDSIKD